MKVTKKYFEKFYLKIKQSRFCSLLSTLSSTTHPVFFLSLFYFFSLFFSSSNRTLLLFTLIYLSLLYKISKNFQQALFFSFLATLPFAKGKSLSLLLLPKGLIAKNALFDIDYHFPIYLSDIFLFILLYLYFRKRPKISRKIKLKRKLSFLFFFIYISLAPALNSLYPYVVILSVIQLLKLSFIYFLPILLDDCQKKIKNIPLILAAFTFFQTFWVILQRFKKGPLGLDLEAYLPKAQYGITSIENVELLRSTGTFFEPSILGTFMLMHFFFFLSLLLLKKYSSEGEKKIYTAAIIAAFVSILFTASRGIYLLILVLVGIFIVFLKKFFYVKLLAFKKESLKLLLLLFPILIGLSFLSVRLQSVGTLFSPEGSGTYRIQISQYAFRLAKNNPFGVGLNLSPYYFATAFPQEKYIFDPAHPHNIFFQILAETGFGGLILFSLFLYASYQSFLKPKTKLRNFEFFIASLAFLACAQIYPIFINHSEILSFFFLYLGFLNLENSTKENSYD